MKSSFFCLAVLSLLFIFPVSALSCEYTMSQPTMAGMCPPGQPAAGSCDILGDAQSFTLTLTSGAVCNPVATCTYTCTPAGEGFTCSNSVVVDDEGGRVTSTIELAPLSEDTYNGVCTSQYKHPEGFTCQWTYATKVTAEFPGK